MLDHTRLSRFLPLGVCALALACDALPKFQFQLQRDIQREFHVTGAMVMVIDTTHMVVAVFDDAHAAFQQKDLAAFEEQVAQYATRHYTRTKLQLVGVIVERANQRGGAGTSQNQPEPTLFVPEYHPDGTVRMAVMPKRQPTTTPVRRKP